MLTRRDDAPLIVTAHLGAACFASLDALRRLHFPAHLNQVPAHVCLFHALPGQAIDEIVATVSRVSRTCESFDLAPKGLRSLGRGVAIDYEAGQLGVLHAALAGEWSDWLTPQDRQRFKPHATIQNKVAPDRARALFEALRQDAFPTCRIEGLRIWRYLAGPWEAVATCPFASSVSMA